jgi:HTH-type transcriptional regulator/antitoxin HigA
VTKLIRTEDEYAEALQQVEALVDLDPEPGSRDANKLELLVLLVQDYETKRLPPVTVDAVDAIQFRMEQQGLTARDLIPYIGSRSRVSEVLSRKRPLTLSMIRALHEGLGIPLKALIQQPSEPGAEDPVLEWDRYPIREMAKRRWFGDHLDVTSEQFEALLGSFFAPMRPAAALYKHTRSEYVRAARPMDRYALQAWTARIVNVSLSGSLPRYRPGSVRLELLRELVRLSPADNGPLLAQEFLRKHGISLVVEPHLPHTQLDGAAVIYQEQRPIVGLTLRHDRIDNFWYCLMHELAHIALHFGQGIVHFYDDLDVGSQDDPREREADALAAEALISKDIWQQSSVRFLHSPQAIERMAIRLHIHPAIIAGRVRHDSNSYRILNQLVGHGQVRKWFPHHSWDQ